MPRKTSPTITAPNGEPSRRESGASSTTWGGVITIIASILIPFLLAIWHVEHRFSEIENRLTKIQDAVKAVASGQGAQTQQLVRDFLATAKASRDEKVTAKAATVASSLLVQLKKDRRPAEPTYFREAVADLNAATPSGPQSAEAIYRARVALAEYRSALEGIPPIPPREELQNVPEDADISIFLRGPVRIDYYVKQSLRIPNPGPSGITNGGGPLTVFVSDPPDDNDIFALDPGAHLNASGFIFIGKSQTMDNLSLQDVIFVNTHIKYHGGPLSMRNVRFVNCTFEVPVDSRGAQLMDYATVESKGPLTLG